MIDALERHSHFVVPSLLALVVMPLALTLLIVGARSPYTHANLMASYDPGYARTDQALVGPAVPFEGMMSAVPLADDPVERGHQLFVVKDCASCHGLDGHGGVVGPSIVGMNAGLLRQVTQNGMGGMPAFAPDVLSDSDLQAIAAYLKAMSSGAPAAASPDAAPELGPQPGPRGAPGAGAFPATTTPSLSAQAAAPAPTLVAAAAAPTTAKPASGTGEDSLKILPSLTAGEKVYAANCASCHGDKGDGKGPASDGLNPPATNLTDLAVARRASPQAWYDSNLNGRPKAMMPAWKGALSESDIWNVLFYIRTFAAPSARIAEGKSLYALNCSICHGDKGDGNGPFAAGANPPPANLTDAAKMTAQSSQALFDILTKGKGTMPDFQSNLTDDQRWSLMDYLWTFVYAP